MRGYGKNSDNSLPRPIMPVYAISPRSMVLNIRLKNLFTIIALTGAIEVGVQALMPYIRFHKRECFPHLVNFSVILCIQLPYSFSGVFRQV